jgi:integrase
MLEDIDAPLVATFLDDLEAERGITARTRNLRLTAIPAKRFTRTRLPVLSRPEVDALLAAPDLRTWSGRRDHVLILPAVQTGQRLSELTGLVPDDLQLGVGPHVRVIGKGRTCRFSEAVADVLAALVGTQCTRYVRRSIRRRLFGVTPWAGMPLRHHLPARTRAPLNFPGAGLRR